MKITGPGKWLRVYIGESDKWHGRPLYQAVVELLRREGLAGATVLRGVEGFGAHSRIHTARILRLSEDLPMVIEVIDRAERIEAVLPKLDAMIGDGLITLIDVNVVTYRTRAELEGEHT
jgi:PII-like signaling protein